MRTSRVAKADPHTVALHMSCMQLVGKDFLPVLHGSSVYGVQPQPSTFLADLSQHLTDLTLATYGNQGRAEHLEAINMLTALQKLRMCTKAAEAPDPRMQPPYCSLSGKTLTWKLPHLDHLAPCCLKEGTIVLSCPKLAEISFARTESLRVKIEDAALEDLVLSHCYDNQFALDCPETQLQSLKKLAVEECFEEGRHVIEDVSHMVNLQELYYLDVPAECMPTSFPQSLQKITLYSHDWCLDVPKGLKDLHLLTAFIFNSTRRPWEFTEPLARSLPVDSLIWVSVGCETYCRFDEAKWKELEKCLGVMTDIVRLEELGSLFRLPLTCSADSHTEASPQSRLYQRGAQRSRNQGR